MTNRWLNAFALTAAALSVVLIGAKNIEGEKQGQLLNVSYDPTRELYADLNARFVTKYERDTGRKLTIKQSHGGSSRQARAVIDGLEADVVTLALPSDIGGLNKRGLIADGWAKRLPNKSEALHFNNHLRCPHGQSLEHQGLARSRPSGRHGCHPKPEEFRQRQIEFPGCLGFCRPKRRRRRGRTRFRSFLYQHAPVLDGGARGAATTFAIEKVGDVHLTWENEALREVADSKGELEIVYPPISIKAEPAVAWVDANVSRHGSEESAKAYLKFLFSGEAQHLIAQHGYRPIDPEVLKKHSSILPPIELFPITAIAKDWEDAQQKFFADNGVFDAIYAPKPR